MSDHQDAIKRQQAEYINVDRGYNILSYILQSSLNRGQELNSLLYSTLSIVDTAQVIYKALELIYISNHSQEGIKCLQIILGKIWDLDVSYSTKINKATNLALENFNSDNNYILGQDDLWKYATAA